MQYEFDGSVIYSGDDVFILGIGPGKVIDVKPNGFRVRAAGRNIKVSFAGVESGKTYPTVFWRDPVFFRPSKDATVYLAQQKLARTVTDVFAQSVVGAELIPVDEPSVDLSEGAQQLKGMNSENLKQMLEDMSSDNNVVPLGGNQAS